MLVGVPERRVVEAVNKLVGMRMDRLRPARSVHHNPISSVEQPLLLLVMADSVVRSAVRLVRSGRLSSAQAPSAAALPSATKTIDSSAR